MSGSTFVDTNVFVYPFDDDVPDKQRRAAIDTSRRSTISYWDALIVEAASSAGCGRLLTEDLAAGQVIRGVEVVNPFR